jgi:hypothetical protein
MLKFSINSIYSTEKTPLLSKQFGVNPEEEQEFLRLKKNFLDRIDLVPDEETQLTLFTTEPEPFLEKYKAVEERAIAAVRRDDSISFYEGVCRALREDSAVAAKLPKGARFEVDQEIIMNQQGHYSNQLQVRLNWAPRFGCCLGF